MRSAEGCENVARAPDPETIRSVREEGCVEIVGSLSLSQDHESQRVLKDAWIVQQLVGRPVHRHTFCRQTGSTRDHGALTFLGSPSASHRRIVPRAVSLFILTEKPSAV